MKNKVSIILSFLLGICLIVGFIIFYDFAETKEASDQQLRLKLFSLWMKEEPIFFDPYMDTEKYSNSVLRYDATMTKFLGIIKGNKISPVDFMEKFGTASTQYAIFKNSVSKENAEKLLVAIRDAQHSYDNDATQIIKSFETLKGTKDADKKIVFLGGEATTDLNLIIADLNLIKKNGEMVAQEIDRREKCLLESSIFCKRFSEKSPSIEFNKKEIIDPQPLSFDILEIPENSKVRGPYLISSSCWNKRDHQWMYMADVCDGNGDCHSQPFLADNKYFNTLGTAPGEKRLSDLGIRLKPMGVTAPYACNDLQYMASLENVDYFMREYDSKRFFSLMYDTDNKQISKIIEDGRSAEKFFFDAKYPSQESLDNLGRYYGHAYYFFQKNGGLDEEKMDQLLKLSILAQGKMLGIPRAIDTLGLFVEIVSKRFEKIGSVPPLLYLYVTKSAYSLLFYPFSSSTWLLNNEKLHMIDIGNEERDVFRINILDFFDFQEAKEKYGEEKLIEWLRAYRETENDEL